MAGMELPARAIREQIAGAVDLIVQISRMSDGTRKVLSITEVVGMQGDTVTLNEIFRFKEEGFDKNRKIIGQFQAMGRIPTFIEDFEARGVAVPRNIFMPEGENNKTISAAQTTGVVNKPRLPGSTTNPLKKVSGGDDR
jgi:pilus assembly protein CpaF